jgi:hypothetical protein
MEDNPRLLLARAQADLVRALSGQGKVPLEFDSARLSLAAKMLLEKRARAVARTWPKLADSLGPRYGEEFFTYSVTHPLPRSSNAMNDGLRFVQFLYHSRRLPDEAHLEWLEYYARNHFIGITCLPVQKRIVLCFRFPWRSRLHLIRI